MSITEILNSKEDLIAGHGASETEILKAEAELKLKFSPEYKEYLLSFGLAMCNGHELTGIGKIDRTNVVLVTKQMKKIHSDIPDQWYVIENTNMDGVVIWQDNKGHIYYNTQPVFESLSDFFIEI